MARRPRCRKVCRLPISASFVPETPGENKEEIVLIVEEYEAMRLIDREGFTQEACGKYMDVARTTAQQIYADARKKVTADLVEGRTLRIKGGAYRLCDGQEEFCGCGGAGRRIVSVNLASFAAGSVYIDCDAEQPDRMVISKTR